MFLTNLLFKKAKSKLVLVIMESLGSGHKYVQIRERVADKLEVVRFDPLVQEMVLYREKKKLPTHGRTS